MKRCFQVWAAAFAIALAACGGRPMPAPASPAPAASAPQKPDVDQAIGSIVDAVFMMDRQTYPDVDLVAYVRKVGQRVAAHVDAPGMKFTFEVTDETAVNAWSVPGGHVYVSRGAIAAINSEAELAGVIGHELGHLAARHPLHEFYLSSLDTRGEGEGIDTDAYERGQEYQADRLAAKYVRAAGYDPRAAVGMLEALYRVGSCPNGDATPREARIARLWRHVGDATGGDLGRDALLDHVDGMVWGEDPRAGALRGSSFTCERCALAMDLPKGWKGEVEDRRLKASHKEEGALEFHRVGGTSTFPIRELLLAQVQVHPFTTETLAGFSVTSGTRLSKGETQHMALLSDGQETWSVAVTGKNADQTLRQVLSTLRRVTGSDSTFAPQRIRIRSAPRSGRFESVAAACCGSSTAMDVLSALNGLQPGEEVRAGRRIKCVGR